MCSSTDIRWSYQEDVVGACGTREMGWEGVDCIYVAQDRDQRQAVLDTVMNHWF